MRPVRYWPQAKAISCKTLLRTCQRGQEADRAGWWAWQQGGGIRGTRGPVPWQLWRLFALMTLTVSDTQTHRETVLGWQLLGETQLLPVHTCTWTHTHTHTHTHTARQEQKESSSSLKGSSAEVTPLPWTTCILSSVMMDWLPIDICHHVSSKGTLSFCLKNTEWGRRKGWERGREGLGPFAASFSSPRG